MQVIFTSLQTAADNHTSTSSLSFFYRPDALPDAQPTNVKALKANSDSNNSSDSRVIFCSCTKLPFSTSCASFIYLL